MGVPATLAIPVPAIPATRVPLPAIVYLPPGRDPIIPRAEAIAEVIAGAITGVIAEAIAEAITARCRAEGYFPRLRPRSSL